MKLATLKDGSRDGRLVVVSRDLKSAVSAEPIAKTMQVALDGWSDVSPRLTRLYDNLNAGRATGAFHFDETQAEAPLPRSYQWIDSSVYASHYRRIKRSMGLSDQHAPPPQVPLMYQGASDEFLAPYSDLALPSEAHEIDFEFELAVITDEVPMGVNPQQAGTHIKLIGIVNDVSLRKLLTGELATGFGPITSKPHNSFAPVVVTPDELGSKWNFKGIDLPARVERNGETFGHPNASGMHFGFDQLIARAAMTRKLRPGTIIGSGTVSSSEDDVGYCCIAERRAVELFELGRQETEFLKFGEQYKMWMEDENGSIFGSIQQKIVKKEPASSL